jgi:serine/threonine protein kinase
LKRATKNCDLVVDYLGDGLIESPNSKVKRYIDMELFGQGSLQNYLRSKYYSMNEEKARHIFSQLVDAVLHLHRLGILHRDIKAPNILYDRFNNQIKLIDFGGSETFFDDQYWDNTLSSMTPLFIPPEAELARMYNERFCGMSAEIWSLGVTLFQIISGGSLPIKKVDMLCLKIAIAQQNISEYSGTIMEALSNITQEYTGNLFLISFEDFDRRMLTAARFVDKRAKI